MKRSSAVAKIALRPVSAVEALRERLAGSTAREHVVLDFLEDDLREARDALEAVREYVDGVEAAIADPEGSPEALLALAAGGGALDRVDALASVLGGVRRRLAQLAARM